MPERPHAKVPGSENSENAYLGECWCQNRGEAWPCPSAACECGHRRGSHDGIGNCWHLAEQAVRRVRELHHEDPNASGWCRHCGELGEGASDCLWPYPTVRAITEALGGEAK